MKNQKLRNAIQMLLTPDFTFSKILIEILKIFQINNVKL